MRRVTLLGPPLTREVPSEDLEVGGGGCCRCDWIGGGLVGPGFPRPNAGGNRGDLCLRREGCRRGRDPMGTLH
jgi:hypothetical protein